VSKSGDSVEDARRQTGSDNRSMLNMVRRFTITVTRTVKWGVRGIRQLDGLTDETRELETFPNIGFFSRPPPGANAEAIGICPGADADNTVIVATRDEATRKRVAGGIDQDETIVFNSVCLAICKKTGKVEVRLPGGVALPLPTMADMENLRQFVVNQFSSAGGHTHAVVGAATTTITTVATPGTAPTVSPAAVVGTTVLMGQ
jgi:hypothetical protein